MRKSEVLRTLREVEDILTKVRICRNRDNFEMLKDHDGNFHYSLNDLYSRITQMISSVK